MKGNLNKQNGQSSERCKYMYKSHDEINLTKKWKSKW